MVRKFSDSQTGVEKLDFTNFELEAAALAPQPIDVAQSATLIGYLLIRHENEWDKYSHLYETEGVPLSPEARTAYFNSFDILRIIADVANVTETELPQDVAASISEILG